jgi:D-arabinose 1-dehydrogenase-like Zn-dependent alcohol dehydrogenase
MSSPAAGHHGGTKRWDLCEYIHLSPSGRDDYKNAYLWKGYVTFPVDQLIPIPNAIESSAAVCPILCTGVTAYSALRKMDPVAGKWCAVAGAAGGVGHLAIQHAKLAFGLKVLAIDAGDDKAEICKSMGADAFVDFFVEEKGLAEKVRQLTNGGAYCILILSPSQGAYKYVYVCLLGEMIYAHVILHSAAGEYARFKAQVMAIGIGNCRYVKMPDATVPNCNH